MRNRKGKTKRFEIESGGRGRNGSGTRDGGLMTANYRTAKGPPMTGLFYSRFFTHELRVFSIPAATLDIYIRPFDLADHWRSEEIFPFDESNVNKLFLENMACKLDRAV